MLSRLLAASALLVALTLPAFAQQATQPGASSASGAGQANTGPSAGQMQQTNPPTTSNSPTAQGGSLQGSGNTGTMPAHQSAKPSGATSGGEVSRSDSAR